MNAAKGSTPLRDADPWLHKDDWQRVLWPSIGAFARYDAIALWVLGGVDESFPLADRSLADTESSAHVPTMGRCARL